jgi:hypothetical protein
MVETLDLTVTAHYSDGSTRDVTATSAWHAGEPAVLDAADAKVRAGAFAGQRACVKAAFAGEHKVGGGEPRVEVEPRGDKLAAGNELRGSGTEQAKCDATRRAGPRRVHECIGLSAVGAEHERDTRAGVLKAAEVGGAQAFLRAVDCRCAARTEQRVVHIARDTERWE